MKRIAFCAALALVAAACSQVGAPSSTTAHVAPVTDVPEVSGRIPVIVDYSPTVSDVGGLLYLLSHPDVEVVGVSLPATGEAGCELGAEVTLGILAMLGQRQVPVACSDEIPEGTHRWPEEFQPRHPGLLFGLPAPESQIDSRDASDLIADVAAASPRPVVIWAVGPLTNVARALTDHPEIAGTIERIVIMGGAVDVEGSPMIDPAEWNFYIDAAAAATVVESGVPITLVPLDATNYVPVPGWYQAALAQVTQTDQVEYLANVVRGFPNATSGFYYFWDELAAAVVTGGLEVDTITETLSVVVGGPENGWSARDPDGVSVVVATGVDPNQFYNHFLSTLSGADVSVGAGASPEEEEYLIAMSDSMVPFIEALEAMWSDPELGSDTSFDPQGVADAIEVVFVGLQASVELASALSPPDSLAEEHEGFLATLMEIVELRVSVIEEIRAASDQSAIDATFARLPDLDAACLPLLDAAQLLGVDAEFPCG